MRVCVCVCVFSGFFLSGDFMFSSVSDAAMVWSGVTRVTYCGMLERNFYDIVSVDVASN